MNQAEWLNSAWLLGCAAEGRAFRRSAGNVATTQQRYLLQLLRSNRATQYGQRFGFDSIKSVQAYQDRVPLTDYASIEPDIRRIGLGVPHVLTHERVELLEPTGGSTDAEKLIPYTRTLRREFQKAVAAWVADLMWHLPAPRRGRAYWSISPMGQSTRFTSGGVPIGFDDDRDYLSRWQRWAVGRLLVVPPRVGQLNSVENARYVTLLFLLSCEDLAVVSVWSPTFLITLLNDIPAQLPTICADLRRGKVRLPAADCESPSLSLAIPRAARRADALAQIFGNAPADESTAEQLTACWPRLALISCWADASSAGYADRLRSWFPRVQLQPKGLLATEGVVSIPLVGIQGHALAVRSHFFEFIEQSADPDDQSCEVRLAHELTTQQRYRIVLSTGGGLYRYQLGDIVEVVGFFRQCPLLRFVGRAGAVSDLVGEKLSEAHVRRVVVSACNELDIRARFWLLAPTGDLPAGYRLFLESESALDDQRQRELARHVDQLLQANPQYRIAIAAKQLMPVCVTRVRRDGWTRYQQELVRRGRKLGDIKPISLDTWPHWHDILFE